VTTAKKRTTRVAITQAQFHELTFPMIGLPVSRAWRGGGTAIFLEIGELTKEIFHCSNGHVVVRQRGQFTAMLEWGWRVERPQSIYFGSRSTDRLIENRFAKLQQGTIEVVDVVGRLPELVVQLSNGLWVHSFSTEEGQPRWYLTLDRNQSPRTWLRSERGRLIKETSRT
jgi:hypothetical protein